MVAPVPSSLPTTRQTQTEFLAPGFNLAQCQLLGPLKSRPNVNQFFVSRIKKIKMKKGSFTPLPRCLGEGTPLEELEFC